MTDKRRLIIDNENGTVLLLVVVVMGLLFILSSMVFGYSLRSLHINDETEDMKRAQMAAEAGLTNAILLIRDEVDDMASIGSMTRNDLSLLEDDAYIVDYLIRDRDTYGSHEYDVSPNRKTMKVNRESLDTIESFDPVPYNRILVEVTGYYNQATQVQAYIVTVYTDSNDYYYFDIQVCD